eukprot:6203742-Pleurochrysis_carterae.AAC.2
MPSTDGVWRFKHTALQAPPKFNGISSALEGAPVFFCELYWPLSTSVLQCCAKATFVTRTVAVKSSWMSCLPTLCSSAGLAAADVPLATPRKNMALRQCRCVRSRELLRPLSGRAASSEERGGDCNDL